jgi:predicted enzyme related to lactoylglutathione lyase
MECFCCGEDREPEAIVPLLCHDEVKVCRMCIGWLARRAGGIDVAPTLPVADMAESISFYEAAGFEVEPYDPGFAFVHLHDQVFGALSLFDGMDRAANHAGCYVQIEDVDGWHGRLAAAGLAVSPVEDMPWGMHEFTLTDPSNNRIRVGRGVATPEDS